MKRDSAHRSDIADVCCYRFVADGMYGVQVANEVAIFRHQIGAEHDRMIRRNVKNGGVISDRDNRRRLKPLPDFAYQSAFAEIVKLHTVASAPFRKRRGPRTILEGLFSSSAAL